MAVDKLKTREYCEPAHTIVTVMGGPHKVARIADVHPSQVWRWCKPAPTGTGGHIPRWRLEKIREYAREHKIAGLSDLISV